MHWVASDKSTGNPQSQKDSNILKRNVAYNWRMESVTLLAPCLYWSSHKDAINLHGPETRDTMQSDDNIV